MNALRKLSCAPLCALLAVLVCAVSLLFAADALTQPEAVSVVMEQTGAMDALVKSLGGSQALRDAVATGPVSGALADYFSQVIRASANRRAMPTAPLSSLQSAFTSAETMLVSSGKYKRNELSSAGRTLAGIVEYLRRAGSLEEILTELKQPTSWALYLRLLFGWPARAGLLALCVVLAALTCLAVGGPNRVLFILPALILPAAAFLYAGYGAMPVSLAPAPWRPLARILQARCCGVGWVLLGLSLALLLSRLAQNEEFREIAGF